MNIAILLLIFLHSSFSFLPLPLSFKTKNIFKLNMKKIKNKSIEYLYTPKNSNQLKYVDILNDDDTDIVVSIGPAGTGKTMFACLKAIDLLKGGKLNKIILTRPIVSVEEELGFLPGNINKKMDPWTRPIFDMFLEHFSKIELDNMINSNVIEIAPLAYMRGRTFKNAFIIADEMQNSSPNQMMMLTTRIGKNSKLVITGDLKQSDKSLNNGLFDFVEKTKNFYNFNLDNQTSNKIQFIEFNKEDIERSRIVEKVIDIYSFKKVETTSEFNRTSNFKLNETRRLNEINVKTNNDAALIPQSHLTPNSNNIVRFRKIWEERGIK